MKPGEGVMVSEIKKIQFENNNEKKNNYRK